MRFRGFVDEWIRESFSNLVDFARSGGTPKSGEHKYYQNGTIPFLSINDLNQKYLSSCSKKITNLAIEETSTFIFEKNNILLSIYATIGEVAINKIDVALPQSILGIKIKKNIGLEYFYYLLLFNKGKLIKYSQTGSQPNLSLNIVNNINLSFCLNIEEQQKISKFLDLLDKQISLLENKLKLTELKMKNFIKQSNIENSELKIKDISIVIDGFPFKQTSYVKEGIPIYTISNIGDNKFIDTIEYKYTNIEIDSKYQLNKGDIFASLTGEKGFKSLLYQNENKNYINQRTIKIEIKNNYSPELLQFWCFKNKRKISLLATGSQKNISKKDVENFLVPKCTKENINLSKMFFNYIKVIQLIQEKTVLLNKRKTFYLKNLFI